MKATQAPEEPARKWRKGNFSAVAFAVAAVALTSALIVSGPAAMLGSAVSHNPGPAMFSAMSVAPTFLARPQTH